jgi:type IV secretory pathway VirB4 component
MNDPSNPLYPYFPSKSANNSGHKMFFGLTRQGKSALLTFLLNQLLQEAEQSLLPRRSPNEGDVDG